MQIILSRNEFIYKYHTPELDKEWANLEVKAVDVRRSMESVLGGEDKMNVDDDEICNNVDFVSEDRKNSGCLEKILMIDSQSRNH